MDALSTEITESMQMYLVSIARLRQGKQPVPLSILADSLSISPVSVNEMCRKLQEMELVTYQPYKGATLTQEGEQSANYILKRHRLWEVFLVDNLGFSYHEAHEFACKLEHDTPNALADRLDEFLNYPKTNPLGEPIPRDNDQSPVHPALPLSDLTPGQQGRLVRWELVDTSLETFLRDQGVAPGAWLQVLALSETGVLLKTAGKHVSLIKDLADLIWVKLQSFPTKTEEETKLMQTFKENSTSSSPDQQDMVTKAPVNKHTTVQQLTLDKLKLGQRGVVVSVKSTGPVKRRMMDMGLVPGSEVRVLRIAPLGDPVEFEVKGYNLTLRKSEAKEIIVEILG